MTPVIVFRDKYTSGVDHQQQPGFVNGLEVIHFSSQSFPSLIPVIPITTGHYARSAGGHLILRNTPTRKSSSNAVKTSSWKSRICRYSDSSTRSAATNTNSTPGKDLEIYLNKHHGSGTTIYEDMCSLTRIGIEEGWAANIEIDGSHYRRSKIALPREDTRFFSITTVYMQSTDIFSGQYHSHPYGEINCVVQIDKSAELMGMQGWQGAGWTSPGPGTHQ
jgi:hypothetical protein